MSAEFLVFIEFNEFSEYLMPTQFMDEGQFIVPGEYNCYRFRGRHGYRPRNPAFL